MTLDRALSRAGVASRTQAAAWIAAGRVSVDGRTARSAEQWVEPARQRIRLDGRPLRPARRLYFAVHKPAGVITSHGDPAGRATVYDLLAASPAPGAASGAGGGAGKRPAPARTKAPRGWLFPVGRLDRDTSGLLLLTNDSVFAERIANPGGGVSKTYLVKVNAVLQEAELARLRAGLDIGRGEHTRPARVRWVRDNGRFCWIEIELHEGRNRQVRRMIEALDHAVLKLVRVRIGRLALAGLPVGAMRAIQPRDVLGV